MNTQKTDWNVYYTKPKSRFSAFTQRRTLKYLLKEIELADLGKDIRVLEFGGGNSCFAEGIRRNPQISRYEIVDNCRAALEKSENNPLIDKAYDLDLSEDLKCPELQGGFHFVYSVGLVEHFSDKERKKVIQNHFACCAEGGVVLITAPTPTFKYRFVRRVMEILKVWQFWDETPIPLERLTEEMGEYGEIVDSGINNLPLTQAVVLCRKR